MSCRVAVCFSKQRKTFLFNVCICQLALVLSPPNGIHPPPRRACFHQACGWLWSYFPETSIRYERTSLTWWTDQPPWLARWAFLRSSCQVEHLRIFINLIVCAIHSKGQLQQDWLFYKVWLKPSTSLSLIMNTLLIQWKPMQAAIKYMPPNLHLHPLRFNELWIIL